MNKENLNIEDIIFRYSNKKELTEKERQFLEGWLAEPGNRKRYQEWKRLEAAVYANGKSKEVDVYAAWERLRKDIARKRYILRTLPWAAAIALLIGCGALFLLQRGQQPTAPVAQQIQEDLTGKIVLTLSDGRQVALSDSLGSLQEQNGTTIENGNQSLVYNPTDSTIAMVYNTIRIPRGAEYKLVLADGSQVWLNAESTITYPVAFQGETREVRLQGEAYFEIAKNKNQPFIVHTTQFDVQVTGTQFNVRAYPGEMESATLAEGGIQLEKGGKTYTLKPGQQAYLEEEEVQVRKVNLESAIAWRYNAFSFEETPLEEIMNELARWYNIHVFYLNPKVKELHFTAWFRRNCTLQEVIDILEKTGRINIELKGKTITVTQKQ